MKRIIYYSIQDGGDGSAYPILLDTKELAQWDQDQMTEAWAEDCWGEFVLRSDRTITCEESLSVNAYYVEHLEEDFDGFNKKAFEDKFYPIFVPKITVKIREWDKKRYYFYVHGVLCYKKCGWVNGEEEPLLTEDTRKKLEIEINRKAQQ